MRANTIKTVEDTVLSMYTDRPEPVTVKEVVAQCKLGETVVRRALHESTRIGLTTKQVKVMSRSYPGHVHQFRSVDAFHPSRRWLVEVIKNAERARQWKEHSTGRGFGG
jgi:hypothetical protein